MVRVKGSTGANPTRPGRPEPLTVTATAVDPEPSESTACDSDRRTCSGATSSSVKMSVADDTSACAMPVTVPATVTVSSVSSIRSSSGVRVKVAVPRRMPAGTVRSKPCTGSKSTARCSPLPATVTDTTVSRGRTSPASVAVTSTATVPEPSESRSGFTASATMQDLAPLEELERLRAEFLGLVSHELRAPLTSIKGSASTVLKRLRRKLGDDADRPAYLFNERGVGYRMARPGSSAISSTVVHDSARP